MADEKDNPQSTPAEPEDAPQAGEDAGKPQAGAPEVMTLEEAKKLRAEANTLRKRLKEKEDADLSKAEKLERDNAALLEELNTLRAERLERIAREDVAEAARKAGAIYPEDVYDLLRASVKTADDGHVSNSTTLINGLRERRPALFRAVSVDGAAGNGKIAAAGGLNQFIRGATG